MRDHLVGAPFPSGGGPSRRAPVSEELLVCRLQGRAFGRVRARLDDIDVVLEDGAPGARTDIATASGHPLAAEPFPAAVLELDPSAALVADETDLHHRVSLGVAAGCPVKTSRRGRSQTTTSPGGRGTVGRPLDQPTPLEGHASLSPNRPWVGSGHQAPIRSVKATKAASGSTATVTVSTGGAGGWAGAAYPGWWRRSSSLLRGRHVGLRCHRSAGVGGEGGEYVVQEEDDPRPAPRRGRHDRRGRAAEPPPGLAATRPASRSARRCCETANWLTSRASVRLRTLRSSPRRVEDAPSRRVTGVRPVRPPH